MNAQQDAANQILLEDGFLVMCITPEAPDRLLFPFVARIGQGNDAVPAGTEALIVAWASEEDAHRQITEHHPRCSCRHVKAIIE